MDANWKAALWQQFGAAVDMLENAVAACPDDLWADRSQRPEYWYLVYHTLFFLDLYLTGSVDAFEPPPPFTLDELDPEGRLPERPYLKGELRGYLEHARRKCRAAVDGLTDETARAPRRLVSFEGSALELLFYNMRHVQHHAAQLNLILRQRTDSAPAWVGKARRPL